MSVPDTKINLDHGMSGRTASRSRRTWTVVNIVVGVILALLFLWFITDVLLLAFAGILLAVFLRTLTDWISAYTGLASSWVLLLVFMVSIGVLGLGSWAMAPAINKQMTALAETVPEAVDKVEQLLKGHPIGRSILSQMQNPEELLPDQSVLLQKLTGAFSLSLEMLADIAIFFFVGLFLAIQPQLYTQGLVRLAPPAYRLRMREVLDKLGQTLQWWLLGQLLTMSIIGVLMALGMWLLGVPLALTLGILAGLLAFIPYIGPVLAAVPAVVLALTKAPVYALYALIIYAGIQFIESYILTPLIQRRTVSLPPVITLLGQVVLGILAGGLGLALATPLIAVILVLVKMLYLADTLGEEVEVP
jgi:predicted PurR-regulated permease PerM